MMMASPCTHPFGSRNTAHLQAGHATLSHARQVKDRQTDSARMHVGSPGFTASGQWNKIWQMFAVAAGSPKFAAFLEK